MPLHRPAWLSSRTVIEVVGQGKLEARLVGGGPPVDVVVPLWSPLPARPIRAGSFGLIKQCVRKTDPRLEAYGDVDELSCHIGVAIATGTLTDRHVEWLRRAQTTCTTWAPTFACPPQTLSSVRGCGSVPITFVGSKKHVMKQTQS